MPAICQISNPFGFLVLRTCPRSPLPLINPQLHFLYHTRLLSHSALFLSLPANAHPISESVGTNASSPVLPMYRSVKFYANVVD